MNCTHGLLMLLNCGHSVLCAVLLECFMDLYLWNVLLNCWWCNQHNFVCFSFHSVRAHLHLTITTNLICDDKTDFFTLSDNNFFDFNLSSHIGCMVTNVTNLQTWHCHHRNRCNTHSWQCHQVSNLLSSSSENSYRTRNWRYQLFPHTCPRLVYCYF